MAMQNNGEEYQVEKTNYNENGHMEQLVYDVQGNREGRFEMLKQSIEQIMRASQFVKFERESEE